jgi:hypothetical protein
VHRLVYQVLLIYPAFFIHPPERVAANYERYKDMADIWGCNSGCAEFLYLHFVLHGGCERASCAPQAV